MSGRRSRILGIIIGVFVLLGLSAPGAAAESGDRITDFTITYTIRDDGIVEVVEEIDYAFAGTDRHGIYRTLITRQPFGDGSDRDVLYRIRDIEVDSPDAPDEWTSSTNHDGFRFSWLKLTIGDPDETLTTRTATYRISYLLEGALRTVDGIPELYWNATGLDWDAAIDQVRVSVSGPQGVTSVSCYQGEAGSTQGCETHTESGAAVAQARDLAAGEGVTISVQVPAGSVSNAEPIVVPGGSLLRAARVSPLTVGGSAAALVLAVFAAVWARRSNRDQRFAGIAPGTIDRSAPVERDTLDRDLIPVRFNPPDVPPALGGALLSTSAVPKVAPAALIELAHAGALTIEAVPDADRKYKKSGGVRRTALARDLSKAPSEYAAAFAAKLFEADERIVLDQPDSTDAKRFQKAVAPLTQAVSKAPMERGWRANEGAARWILILVLGLAGVLGVIGFSFAALGRGALLYLGPLALAALALIVAIVLWSTGHLTAEGRALRDQVEGFRRYIETAEARTLKFEEGQDIFSAFLPWAIIFGLAERWQKVCAELAAQGRIPESPAWYTGPAFYSTFSSGSSFGESLSTSVSSSAATSGSGGSGSSGGGGGGGGGGSW
ncbi:MAG TPA: DUF2207 domain-containing protein [Intrasporangiaceae bacterium]|nr:DUF2207 domain-containing protein [Intrasporangiaceae bacterium]